MAHNLELTYNVDVIYNIDELIAKKEDLILKVGLFDNTISYNEMQIALNLEKTQDLIFRFEKNNFSKKFYVVWRLIIFNLVSQLVCTR